MRYPSNFQLNSSNQALDGVSQFLLKNQEISVALVFGSFAQNQSQLEHSSAQSVELGPWFFVESIVKELQNHSTIPFVEDPLLLAEMLQWIWLEDRDHYLIRDILLVIRRKRFVFQDEDLDLV